MMGMLRSLARRGTGYAYRYETSGLLSGYGRLASGTLLGSKLMEGSKIFFPPGCGRWALGTRLGLKLIEDPERRLFATWMRRASGRPRWMLDANFVINLFQTATNKAEATTKEAATEVYGKLQRDRAEMLFPEVCLAEAAHFLRKQNRDGMLLAKVLDGMFEMVTMKDRGVWRRVRELHSLHSAHDRMSLVDCCIVSIAENLGVINLATFDRRHMLMVKPKHTEVFNILP